MAAHGVVTSELPIEEKIKTQPLEDKVHSFLGQEMGVPPRFPGT